MPWPSLSTQKSNSSALISEVSPTRSSSFSVSPIYMLIPTKNLLTPCRAIAALSRMSQKKESITFVILSFAWCHQESNRGHKDFQSFALPTELWHLAFVCECKGIANFITVQIFLIKFLRINEWEIAKKAASR